MGSLTQQDLQYPWEEDSGSIKKSTFNKTSK